MARTLLVLVLGIVVGAIAGAVCYRLVKPCKQRMVEYSIVDECHLEYAGQPVTRLRLPVSTPIRWINKTQSQVGLEFAAGVMKEGVEFTIQAGDSTVTTTTKRGFTGKGGEFRYRCEGILPPPPQPENCPPPPALCP